MLNHKNQRKTLIIGSAVNSKIVGPAQGPTRNMAIVMHCNLRPPDAMPVVLRFNYDAHTKAEVGKPIHFRF